MPATFDGKVALVTGAASGIGRAAAMAFAREGARVVAADLNARGGEETVGKIKEAGGDAVFVRTDVTKAAQVEVMVKRAVEAYSRLDCAFNNAGIPGARVPTHEYPEDDWDLVTSILLKGVWLCMKYELAQMLQNGGGAIVNTSSIAGLVGRPNASAYVAAKHGVNGLTRTAALEYAQRGIRVNSVCPGWIRTPLIDNLTRNPETEAEVAARHPIGRLGTPEDVAETVIWLCSDAASFVTGHLMAVDGGFTAT
ncbi:MAG: SDR family oxidoreductase [Chloroflexi bacterium]|nr:SDR family oxidoreductase [Chloroflexota bacterium]